MSYQLKNHVRIITAASLFDGHDASINIMRRLLQAGGAEVIHLGHNRSVLDIVNAALQEDAQGIAVSSYQGGHMEFFKYMIDLLKENSASHVRVFGGGGGVIVPEEKRELEKYGVSHIYHPEDGRRLGLEGMIEEVLRECDFDTLTTRKDSILKNPLVKSPISWPNQLSQLITICEQNEKNLRPEWLVPFLKREKRAPVIGLTGPGGAGKSSLTDELLQRFLNNYPGFKIATLCVDPTKKKTGGALLGDRIRLNSVSREGVFMRSLATRGSGSEIAHSLSDAISLCQHSNFDMIFIETVGTGQGDMAITELVDVALYVMTGEFGAPSQLEKIDMIDFADLIAVNKSDRRGAPDALRDVRKQYRRSRKLFEKPADEELPVFGTVSSHFNDGGVNLLFLRLCDVLREKKFKIEKPKELNLLTSERMQIIPMENQNYLAEITKTVRQYKKKTLEQSEVASKLGAVKQTKEILGKSVDELEQAEKKLAGVLDSQTLEDLAQWDELISSYKKDELIYKVRGEAIHRPLTITTLSHTKIPKVSVPSLKDWGDRLKYLRFENTPGRFPYTSGVFPLKRVGEDPRRQFAGEGPPERTNKRFHLLSEGDKAKRLSTAFDSVTLYGEDPHERPDIYGKVGESGVSICTLDDMKKLYAGFDLCDPATSVSMTINGPAPTILAFFLNTAIDQRIENFEKAQGKKATSDEREKLRRETLKLVRGTVQADILKEDQAQNTCIFSTEFSLKVMGDVQKYFIDHAVKNYYSVSISGYHIAEAGANPISQLAFTLANGFTYVEHYLSRGMPIDEFAPNLSFFFSNGLDAEYAVLGRVARRIWAVTMRDKYGASPRAQMLKYHIQTSGRSLHAQEITFNDIRTTLQALFAIYDNCNSLHTNAYDEAITTPTEESVRRAMAIQMIINNELGTAKNENPGSGSYFMEELTDLVEEAVLAEFNRIAERGGVLGAMESQYQRGKIQEESLYYETLKHNGVLPIIGVNTFLDPNSHPQTVTTQKLVRATREEKEQQIKNLRDFQKRHQAESPAALKRLRETVLSGGNVFETLMDVARVCSLGQITHALFEVGGQYRRSL